ncbi:nitronate monooxygenase [Pusillimonas caeni]|nr:nitronate monooxygenase [Pusillimonas caeni]
MIRGNRLPLMVAPMFLVSGPDLAIAAEKSGVIGSFPAPNARDVPALRQWMVRIRDEIAAGSWALNMIVHRSYERFDQELALVEEFRPPIVATALGSPRRVMDAVHGYGGIVMADVTTPTLARKAVDAGVDVLVLVTHGAGGHTGTCHPFALLHEVRQFWPGPLGLAGAISCGRDIRAAQVLGADFAVMGTRFIATVESLAGEGYRDMLVASGIEDLVASAEISGVMANWLKGSIQKNGEAAPAASKKTEIDFSGNISVAPKAWKDVWSAGHGVGGITRVQSVMEVVDQLQEQYLACLADEASFLKAMTSQGAG